MASLQSVNPKTIRTRMVGLLVECPLGGRPDDCQFHNKKDQPFIDSFNWIQDLDESELEKFYQTHVDCMKKKLTI